MDGFKVLANGIRVLAPLILNAQRKPLPPDFSSLEASLKQAPTAPPAPQEILNPPANPPTSAEYSGTSQLSAKGKGCIPCGSSHFQTVAGGLAEAIRFARQDGIEHPEVLDRINAAETELNTFERWDASPDKIAALPESEKAFIDEMLVESRRLRHLMSDIKNLDDLETTAAEAAQVNRAYRQRLFQMQLSKLSQSEREIIKKRATELLTQQLGGAPILKTATPQSEASQPNPGSAKETWQMTKAERATYMEQKGKEAIQKWNESGSKGFPPSNPERWGVAEINKAADELGMPWGEGRVTIPQHKYEVMVALKQGKPIPPEVLKDYPDLVKQYQTSKR